MYKISIFARDKKGNRGPLITRSYYPTQENAADAKTSVVFLCTHPNLAKKEGWKLKNCIVTGPTKTTNNDPKWSL